MRWITFSYLAHSATLPDFLYGNNLYRSNNDEYLRKRLMPVEGAIPHVQGIEMYGNSIPAETIGGDLFEYINFQQRYDIDTRIQGALRLAKECLEPPASGASLLRALIRTR